MKLQADLANPRSLIEILSRPEHWQRTLDWTWTVTRCREYLRYLWVL